MRVAVHFHKDHPLAQGDGPAVVAYRLGRIEDGVHNHLIHSGETIPLDDFVAGLVKQAKAEYPDAEVRIERLVEAGKGRSTWVDAREFDPEKHTPVGAGEILERTIHATNGQSAGKG